MAENPKQSPMRRAFDAGIAHGKDPARRDAATGSGTITTAKSPWLGQGCPTCGHTFRRGDRVDVSATISHSRAQGCPDEPTASLAETSSAVRQAFYCGVAAAHPPPPGLPLVRLLPGHPLLDASGPLPFRRPTCAICGHSLRPFDEVVVCPCDPHAPLCRAAVHRDAVRGLYCWDEWSRSKLSRHCPVTSRRLA